MHLYPFVIDSNSQIIFYTHSKKLNFFINVKKMFIILPLEVKKKFTTSKKIKKNQKTIAESGEDFFVKQSFLFLLTFELIKINVNFKKARIILVTMHVDFWYKKHHEII